jgi:hypothetical protein
MPAMFTTPTLVMAVPLMLLAATLAANHTLTLAHFTKVLLTRFLVLESLAKLYKFHDCRIFVQR